MTPLQRLMSELRQRHVLRVVGAYLAGSFVVVQVADLLVGPLNLPGWTMRLVILAVVIGLPVAIALSWVLEVTPEGIRRAARSDVAEDDLAYRRRALAVATVMLGIIVAGSVTAWALRGDAPVEASRSIAVLPFVDVSPGADQRYFSDGLTEELTAALSRVDGLQVAARTAAFQFADAAADLGEVGARLKVATVLEGSVRRAGDQLRVTVRLVDVNTGYELWTEIFNEQMSDVFAVQEAIAREVLNRLRFPETGDPIVEPGTRDFAAYDHLLRGNYHLTQRSPDEVRRAIAAYERAWGEDPDFATALFRHGYAYLIYADWGWHHPELSRDALLTRAADLVARGLSIEPGSAEGWLARGYLRVMEEPLAMTGALEAFERSLELDAGNPEAWHQYGQTLMVLGRYDEATSAYNRALDAEPHRSMTLVPLAAIALYDGQLEEALRWADSAIALDPANSYARASRARIHLTSGDLVRARDDAELAMGIDQGHAVAVAATLAVALARTGAMDSAQSAFRATLEAAGPGPVSANDAPYIAMAAVAVGEVDQAIAMLRRVQNRGAWFWFYMQTPLLDPLRADPRFRQLVAEADPR